MGSNFMDEIDCGSFFDQFDDLIEFPVDNLGSGDCTGDFPTIWSNPPADTLPTADPIFSGNYSTSTGGGSDISAELSVPYEDIVQLEWLSNFVEDSFSGGGMTLDKDNFFIHNESSQNQLQNSSPISVLESSSSSSSSCSRGKTIPTQRGLQRARSKRPRPPTFNPRPAIPLIPSPVPSSESENFAESYRTEVVVKKIPKAAAAKNKTKTKLLPSMGSPVEMNQNLPPLQSSVRKCMHCEITKTPQWRSGPMGPKTLCNACGVRYKSGRLFPEYRPAASPTFVPSLHSNSHKKVTEMRNRVSDDTVVLITATTTPSTTNQPELIPSTF